MTKTWAQRLEAAEKRRGRFTQQDVDRARQWLTCAVGEFKGRYKVEQDLINVIPAFPQSARLLRLGTQFFEFVNTHKLVEARPTYLAIQRYFGGRRKKRPAAGRIRRRS